MKKAVIWTIIAVLIAALAVGAWTWLENTKKQDEDASQNQSPKAPDDQNGDFQIWPEQATTTVKRGARGEILVHLKNNTGKDYSYQGSYYSFRPTARLVSADGKHEIAFDELPMTMEFAHYTIANGEVRDAVFSFSVPADAAVGSYDLVLSFENSTVRHANALQVTE